MLQVIGTAAAALVGAHRYSNSNKTVLVGAVELNACTVRYNGGYSNGASEKAKKATHKQKNDKGAKANTPVTV